MIRFLALLCVSLATLALPAQANDAVLDRAISQALDAFEQARPELGGDLFGVDVTAFRDALSLGQFASAHWGGTTQVRYEIGADSSGDCSRFAAYTAFPPKNGQIALVLCPQFFAEGADALRRLTILHEMVHAVAGGDECRAMAFAARVEEAGLGGWTPVDRYWRANDCDGSAFSLPQ